MKIIELLKKFCLILNLLVFFSTMLISQDNQLFLRVNSTMHNSQIPRISIDKAEKYILTCSWDKTGKLWDAATGEIIRTFRPPIDHGSEGMLYACALSPDASIAVFGGYTGYKWNKKHSIYIFSTSSGKLLHQLTDLKNVIYDLEFSANGHYLAAGCGSRAGLHIYHNPEPISNPAGFSEYKKITNYKSSIFSIAFDNRGRLATVCQDNKIQLYDSSFKKIAQAKGSGIKTLRPPMTLAFSPDGSKLAVGYWLIYEIDVFNTDDLSMSYQTISPSTDYDSYPNAVCFSSDGRYLYAGGTYYGQLTGDEWEWVIHRWDEAGRGKFTRFPANDNSTSRAFLI